nr:MAG TPA: hypothetical protein [Caudoviricetes sp.]
MTNERHIFIVRPRYRSKRHYRMKENAYFCTEVGKLCAA